MNGPSPNHEWSPASARYFGAAAGVPHHGRMFIRGVGWIPVEQRPNRPRGRAMSLAFATLKQRQCRLTRQRRCLDQIPARRLALGQQLAIAIGGMCRGGSQPWLRMGGHAWRAAARLACTQRAACADHGRLRRISATAARTVAMRLGIDATRLLAECGQFPYANKREQRYMQEVRFRFHNVCGMRSDRLAREAYLRAGGDVCDVLVLAETNCVGGEQVERQWSRAWPNGFEALWASDTQGRVARGMAVFVSKRLPQAEPRLALADPEGRFIAIWLTIFGRRTLLIGSHADNASDSDQAAFYHRLRAGLPIPPADTDVIWLGDMNNVEDRGVDYTCTHPLPRRLDSTRALGVASMRAVSHALGDLADAFRTLHPSGREYTHRAPQAGSRARLDRAYVSTHLLRGSHAPLLTAAGHISPSAESLALLGLGDVHLRSDHAALSVVVRYSDDEYVPPKWHIPRHLLTAQRLPCVLHMRDIVREGMAKMELSPIQRVLYILETTRLYCQKTVREDSRQRSCRRHLLLQQLQRCERFLGRGVTEPHLHDPPARELAERQLLEVEAQLQLIRQADHARWLADRAYDEHAHSDRCSRSFFEGTRQDRVDSTIREVREGTVRSSGTKHVLRAARRFYGGPGGFFNNGVRTQKTAESSLLDALVADGRVQPESRREDLSLESICSPAAVQRAIEGLPNYAMPGLDGFTTDYFKVMTAVREQAEGDGERPPHPFCTLLGEAFKEIVRRPEGLPSEMVTVVVSLIYKEKGYRYDLSRYRPIAVMSVLYKIMTRCMADALQPSLPYLVAPTQNAFQRSKFIFDDNRTVLDAVTYLEQNDRGGVFVFCDQKSAYPRVQWGFLARVMERMNLHPDFRRMVASLYEHASVHIKVNGQLSDTFDPCHGLHQGCPCSPCLYLLCLQTFMSLMATDDGDGDESRRLRGIRLPRRDGSLEETYALGYADDLVGLLADEQQLVRFKELLSVYEQGSGAENDWAEKTAAIRVGSLKSSTAMPVWDGPSESQLFGRESTIRYLGIFLGTPSAVAREWEKRTTARVRARYAQWSLRGNARTIFGRNIVVRNSVMAVCWYLISNQCPPNLDDMLAAWERETWAFVEQPGGAPLLQPQGRDSPVHAAPRALLVQDYPEGGARCLDIECFTRALYMRHVRRLLDPVEQGWKGMVMHWLDRHYGFLRQGYRLLLSACDFLAVLDDAVSPFWQNVLVSWGMFAPPLPLPDGSASSSTQDLPTEARAHAAASRDFDSIWDGGAPRPAIPLTGWSLLTVALEPLAYNQLISGVWGARVREPTQTADVLQRDHSRGSATLTRVSAARRARAAMVLRRYQQVANAGFTHAAPPPLIFDTTACDFGLGRVRVRCYCLL